MWQRLRLPSLRVAKAPSFQLLRPTALSALGGGFSVRQAELKAEDVVAANGVNRRPIAPALASHLTDHVLASRGYGIGDFLAEVKITPDTFVIWAAEREDGFGVSEVHRIFDLAAAMNPFGIKKLQIHGQ